jgi:hypothetical protein
MYGGLHGGALPALGDDVRIALAGPRQERLGQLQMGAWVAVSVFRILHAGHSLRLQQWSTIRSSPTLLKIRESSTGEVGVLWQLSALQAAGDPLKVVLFVERMLLLAPVLNRIGGRAMIRWSAQCGEGSLVGWPIGVAGLRECATDAVLRDPLRLGSEHILSGPDHLLFVLGSECMVSMLHRRVVHSVCSVPATFA